jgi:hypothetical protein
MALCLRIGGPDVHARIAPRPAVPYNLTKVSAVFKTRLDTQRNKPS